MSRPVLIARFKAQADIVAAASSARKAGLTIVDAYTPYPVAALHEAMGLKTSRLGYIGFACGVTAGLAMLSLELWVSTSDWPLNIGGRPDNSLPAFVPPAFEFGVLFAALSAVLALLLRSRLFPGKQAWVPAPGVSDDSFALVIDPGPSGSQAAALLSKHNAVVVEEPSGERP